MKKHRDVRRVSRNAPRAKGKELDPGFRRDDDLGGVRRDDDVDAFEKMTNREGFRRNDEGWSSRRDDKAVS